MKKTEYHVAIVGATGAVGTKIKELLEQDTQFAIGQLKLLSSRRSAGTLIPFRDEVIQCEELTATSFEDVDIAFFSAGGEVSRQFVPIAVRSGAIVIDNTSEFRMHKEVPLVVPEVNPHVLQTHQGIVSVPNCSALQMVTALTPIHLTYGLERIIVSTYQAVSGSGVGAITELLSQAQASLQGEPAQANLLPAKKDQKHYPIAFNVLPQVDVFTDNDYSFEEQKMMDETKKIMELPFLKMAATCVRVPVVTGHSESVYIELATPASVSEIRELLSQSPGVVVQDNPAEQLYPTPLQAAGSPDVFVGRIRKDPDIPNGFHLWIVSDNLLKGAAWNSLQIAHSLMEQDLI